MTTVADPQFPMGGPGGLPMRLCFDIFVSQNERMRTLEGHMPACPLDPPTDESISFIPGFMTIPRTVGEYVVAFSASRTIAPGNPGPASVSFNEVSFNIGDDFNPTTGTFLCRIPGVYLFTVSAGANVTGGRSSCRYITL